MFWHLVQHCGHSGHNLTNAECNISHIEILSCIEVLRISGQIELDLLSRVNDSVK